MKDIYKEMDYNNRLENCPPFVRVPSSKLQEVKIDSYECTRCKSAVRDIINLDCMHCYLCYNCFKLKNDKFKCNICDQKVEKIVRIYVCSSKDS